MVEIIIDGQNYQVEEGISVMKAARSLGIQIPGLCYHPALKPSASCKLCSVETESGSAKGRLSLACTLKVTSGMVIQTQSEAVINARKKAFQDLILMAPEAKIIRQLAAESGIDLGPVPDGCIRCSLCVRVCKEVVGAGALKMVKVGGRKLVMPLADRCIGCGTCVSICPTSVIRMEDDAGVRIIAIRDDLIGRLPLARCEACGRYYATKRFLEFVANRTTTHVDLKEHHAYCSTCAKLLAERTKSPVPFRLL